jgi:hypothetical protein
VIQRRNALCEIQLASDTQVTTKSILTQIARFVEFAELANQELSVTCVAYGLSGFCIRLGTWRTKRWCGGGVGFAN